MAARAAAASARNRHRQANFRRDTSAPDVSKGLLVARQVPVPKRSKKKIKDKKNKKNSNHASSTRNLPVQQQSFRQKMSSSMQQWKSAPALKVDADEKSTTGSVKGLEQQQQSKRKGNKAGFKRFLSRGNSSRTDDTFESLGTLSDRLNPGPAPPLSPSFPPSDSTQQYLIRRPTVKGELITTIENQRGKVVAVVEETHYGRSLLKDKDGKVCAMILLHEEKYAPSSFSICGTQPIVHKQSMKFDQVGLGYYKWADVKNAGGFGGTISLKHVKDEICPMDHTFCTKMFGSVFRLKKTRGHVVLDENKKECAKLIALPNTGRAVQISPKQDVAMMLCYSVIIDQVLEQRMR